MTRVSVLRERTSRSDRRFDSSQFHEPRAEFRPAGYYERTESSVPKYAMITSEKMMRDELSEYITVCSIFFFIFDRKIIFRPNNTLGPVIS